jgi:hypothetical protein
MVSILRDGVVMAVPASSMIALPDAAKAKANKNKDINADRDKSLMNPNALAVANGLMFQVDPFSMKLLNDSITLYAAKGATPSWFTWRDYNNIDHPADLSFLVAIAEARSLQVSSIWQTGKNRKDALNAIDLNASDAIEQIEAVQPLASL